jgi:hypothetical protein
MINYENVYMVLFSRRFADCKPLICASAAKKKWNLFCCPGNNRLPAEIVTGIVEADILYHFAHPFHIVWQFAIFYFLSEKITQDPPEIFMPWER